MQKYQDVAAIIGPPGLIPIVGANVVVYDHGTINTSSIFSDNASTVTANPLTTDASGRYAFYAGDGRYDLRVYGNGIQTTDLTDIVLADSANTSDLMRFIPNSAKSAIQAGTFTGDLTNYVNLAISDMHDLGGGVIYVQPGVYPGNYQLLEGVFLVGRLYSRGDVASFGPTSRPIFTAYATGTVIDTPATPIGPCGILGVAVTGPGSSTTAKGIRLRDVTGGVVAGVSFNNFTDEGLLVDVNCNEINLENLLATNCVLNRTRAATIGAIDVSGTDHYAFKVRGGISGQAQGNVQSVNLYCVGIAWRADESDLIAVRGEFSDIGVHILGTENNCIIRGDNNYGHGVLLDGGSNIVTGSRFVNNSQGTTNTYDNFRASANAGNSQVNNCRAIASSAKRAKYGFNDLISSATNKVQYGENNLSSGAATSDYNFVSANGSPITSPGRRRQSQGVAVVSANNLSLGFDGTYFQVTGAVQINLLDSTNWPDGFSITLKFNSTPTVKHNQIGSGNFRPIMLAGGVDFVASANDTLTLRVDYTDGVWYQTGVAVI